MKMIVNFEYEDTDNWNCGTNQPANVSTIQEAKKLAIHHFKKSGHCDTRVAVYDKGEMVAEWSDFGFDEWIKPATI
jgi:hypothetical protein